ncbi:MAG: hydrolase [Solirubrobacterales bacterium]|nr:hydrolase [Solirubrobacterales bacterium]
MGQSIFDPRRTLAQRRSALTNLMDFLVTGGIADRTRMPAQLIHTGPQCAVYRYDAAPGVASLGSPVLLVPPLGSPAMCFDLRRGCSVAEHFVNAGRPTYLVDYGPIAFSDRHLGLEHWVADVLPHAVRRVSDDAGDAPVALVGWCLGGIFGLLTAAAFPELPIAAVAMVASPFDFAKNPLTAPVRVAGKVTGGRALGGATRALGGLPSQLVGPAFKLTALPAYLKKPLTLYHHRDDREFLAQIEAVDRLMNEMHAFPGRATLQAYQRLLHRNELASGQITGPTRTVDLADVRIPVMNVAGTSDVLAPKAAAHHVGSLLTSSPDVRLPDAPGGHLGVLTGARAATTTWTYIDDFLDAQP